MTFKDGQLNAFKNKSESDIKISHSSKTWLKPDFYNAETYAEGERLLKDIKAQLKSNKAYNLLTNGMKDQNILELHPTGNMSDKQTYRLDVKGVIMEGSRPPVFISIILSFSDNKIIVQLGDSKKNMYESAVYMHVGDGINLTPNYNHLKEKILNFAAFGKIYD